MLKIEVGLSGDWGFGNEMFLESFEIEVKLRIMKDVVREWVDFWIVGGFFYLWIVRFGS